MNNNASVCEAVVQNPPLSWGPLPACVSVTGARILSVPPGAIPPVSPPLLFNEVRCSLITGPEPSNEYHKQSH